MPIQELLAVAVAVTVMLGCLAAIGRTIQVTVRGGRRVFRLIDEWAGEPPSPGNPDGRPGLLERLFNIEKGVAAIPPLLLRVGALEARVTALEERTAAVEAELLPNGGGSLRDSVDRVAAAVAPVDPPPAQPAAGI